MEFTLQISLIGINQPALPCRIRNDGVMTLFDNLKKGVYEALMVHGSLMFDDFRMFSVNQGMTAAIYDDRTAYSAFMMWRSNGCHGTVFVELVNPRPKAQVQPSFSQGTQTVPTSYNSQESMEMQTEPVPTDLMPSRNVVPYDQYDQRKMNSTPSSSTPTNRGVGSSSQTPASGTVYIHVDGNPQSNPTPTKQQTSLEEQLWNFVFDNCEPAVKFHMREVSSRITKELISTALKDEEGRNGLNIFAEGWLTAVKKRIEGGDRHDVQKTTTAAPRETTASRLPHCKIIQRLSLKDIEIIRGNGMEQVDAKWRVQNDGDYSLNSENLEIRRVQGPSNTEEFLNLENLLPGKEATLEINFGTNEIPLGKHLFEWEIWDKKTGSVVLKGLETTVEIKASDVYGSSGYGMTAQPNREAYGSQPDYNTNYPPLGAEPASGKDGAVPMADEQEPEAMCGMILRRITDSPVVINRGERAKEIATVDWEVKNTGDISWKKKYLEVRTTRAPKGSEIKFQIPSSLKPDKTGIVTIQLLTRRVPVGVHEFDFSLYDTRGDSTVLNRLLFTLEIIDPPPRPAPKQEPERTVLVSKYSGRTDRRDCSNQTVQRGISPEEVTIIWTVINTGTIPWDSHNLKLQMVDGPKEARIKHSITDFVQPKGNGTITVVVDTSNLAEKRYEFKWSLLDSRNNAPVLANLPIAITIQKADPAAIAAHQATGDRGERSDRSDLPAANAPARRRNEDDYFSSFTPAGSGAAAAAAAAVSSPDTGSHSSPSSNRSPTTAGTTAVSACRSTETKPTFDSGRASDVPNVPCVPKAAYNVTRSLFSAQFVSDANTIESAVPGHGFIKAWKVRNDGFYSWPKGCSIVPMNGSAVQCSNSNVPLAKRNEEVAVFTTITIPATTGVGEFSQDFMLIDDKRNSMLAAPLTLKVMLNGANTPSVPPPQTRDPLLDEALKYGQLR